VIGRLLPLLLLLLLAVTGCDDGEPAADSKPAAAAAGTEPRIEPCPAAGVATSNLPAIALPCLAGGGEVALPELLDGRPAIINFWASSCAPCVRELPLLQRLHTRPDRAVQVLGVLSADPSDNWRDLLARTGATFPSVRDDRRRLFADLELVGALPVSLLVRADGTLAWAHYGDVDDPGEIERLLDEHLGVRL
jgi:thiol-disulfide isomerase/thioredoxin